MCEKRAKLMIVSRPTQGDGEIVFWKKGTYPFKRPLTESDESLTFEELAETYELDLPEAVDYKDWQADLEY